MAPQGRLACGNVCMLEHRTEEESRWSHY